MPRRERAVPLVLLRLGAGFLGLAGLALAAIRLARPWSEGGSGADGTVVGLLVGLTWGVGFAFLAVVVAWRAPADRGVLTGGIFFGAFSTFFYGIGVLTAAPGVRSPIPLVITGAFTYAIGVRFTQLFPVPLARGRAALFGPRWCRATVGRALDVLLAPRFFWLFTVVMEATVHALRVSTLAFAHVITWAGLGAGYLWLGYREGGEDDRRRTFWVLEAALVFLCVEVLQFGVWATDALGLMSLDVPGWTGWLDVIEAACVLVCLFFAIFGAGAFDSRLLLKRTTIVSASSGAALLLFLVLEETLMELGGEALGIESRTGAIVSGVVAAIFFQGVAKRFGGLLGTRGGRPTPEPDP